MMHALQVSMKKKLAGEVSYQGLKSEFQENFSIHKDIGIVGVDVARRSQYQLFASILFLVNFRLRKVERHSELFAGTRKPEA